MFIKKYSDCEQLKMTGKKDSSIEVSFIEMFRPEDGFELPYNVAQFEVPVGKRTDRYSLNVSTELWFIKQGNGEVEIDGKVTSLNADAVVYINPGEVRCFINRGNVPLIYFSIAKPPFDPRNVVPHDDVSVEALGARPSPAGL